ncbi:MAG: PQQ-binding-like beta-propeller repeat protein [Bryobacterales bacterium]|nr:PQQ-binding-like beta-propeller repeat protein [Bryobacterales bacterium]
MKCIVRVGFSLLAAGGLLVAGDWPEWRGPNRDGTSAEKGLIDKWSLAGENLAWKAPYGGRSTPVVFGGRLYLLNAGGKGETLQERLLCFDADSGKVLWERRWNLYMSDVPPHRIAWASPVVDPETANVYAFGGNGSLHAFTRDGKPLWTRPLVEDYGLFTTHGGRTPSPMIDGDLIIVSAIASTWGAMANRSHRLMAFDKRTGETVWVSTPGGRPYDTSYSNPLITTAGGQRLIVMGLGDGSIVGLKPQTGEPVWRFVMAKRGINTAVAMAGKYAIASHSEENLDTSTMGMIAALDVSGKGELTKQAVKWSVAGFEAGFSSPVADGDRIYQMDNTANLVGFDAQTGRELWKKALGSAQKASPVLADGKLYVGTEGGKFYILKPRGDTVEILSEVELPPSKEGIFSAGTPEPVIASPAVAHGRIYFVSSDTLYALGRKTAVKEPPVKPEPLPKGEGAPAWVQVRPYETLIKPGESVRFRALLYDAQGRFLREEQAAYSLQGLKGQVSGSTFTADKTNAGQAGLVKATAAGLTGEARVRVAPVAPWSENFESMPVGAPPLNWISASTGKYQVQEDGGGKILVKPPDETIFRRMRVFFGPDDMANYTVEADVRAAERRRQLGDVGIIAQRYALILFGNNQKLELQPWQPETTRTVSAPFEWKKDEWYHLKLRVENQDGGKVRVQGKAWKTGDAEPAAWNIDKVDPVGNREGSPGLFGDAQYGVHYDNLKVTANQ